MPEPFVQADLRLDPHWVEERRRARMLALQALCVFEALGDDFKPQLGSFLRDELILTDLGIDPPPPEELVRFAYQLATGAWSERRSLDERLERAAVRWRLARMTPVDRNVLRLCLHEMMLESPDSPWEVVMSEAVELAQKFGDTESHAFVNGVLDAARRDWEKDRAGVPIVPSDSQTLNPEP
jgi:transcription antitermination protein NusB